MARISLILITFLASIAVAQTPPLFQDGFRSKGSASFGTSSVADSKSIVDMVSTAKGLLIPRMTTTQRNAIASPTTGLEIFNTTLGHFQFYTGAAWVDVSAYLGTATSLSASAAFQVDSTTGGVLFPRMTQTQRDAISSPAPALVVFNTDTNKYNFFNGTTWAEMGSGSGGILNLINDLNVNDGTFEDGTTGTWAAYNDGATAKPVDGTGGSPSGDLTFVASGSTPLEGSFSALLTKANGNNNQGEGFSLSAVPVQPYLRGSSVTVGMYFAKTSGTYALGDLGLFMYDQTNSEIVKCDSYQIPITMTGIAEKFEMHCDTKTNTALLRPIIHQASTTANNYALKFDKFFITDVSAPADSSTTGPWVDLTQFVPWIQEGTSNEVACTNTTTTAKARRIGDSLEVYVRFDFTGVPGTCTGLIGIKIFSSYFDFAALGLPPGSQSIKGTGSFYDDSAGKWFSAAGRITDQISPAAQFITIPITSISGNGDGVDPNTGSPSGGIAANDYAEAWFTMPVKSFSAGTVTTQSRVEYSCNTGMGDADDTTSFYFGANGCAVPTTAYSADHTKYIHWNQKVGPRDSIKFQVQPNVAVDAWFDIPQYYNDEGGAGMYQYSGGDFGMGMDRQFDDQTSRAVFAHYRAPSSTAWTGVSTSRWRMVKYANALPVTSEKPYLLYTQSNAAYVNSNGNYPSHSDNFVTLSPGLWKLDGDLFCDTPTNAPNMIYDCSSFWTLADGANTGSQPALISTSPDLSVTGRDYMYGAFGFGSINGIYHYFILRAALVYVRVYSTTTIYLTSAGASNNPTNYTQKVQIFAEKIQ